MTLPPPPDPYGSQPPHGGGQPGGGVSPQWGSQQGGVPPQGFGGGYGPPPQGPWGPQQQWPGGPGGQPPKSGRGKWILGGIAVVLAIALAVVITVLVVRPADGGGGNGDPTTQNGDSEFASADDTGPVNIITEDPTCAAWLKIARAYAEKTAAVKWIDRDQSVPASRWTPEDRAMYETASNALSEAATSTVRLAQQTPHRTVRELYQQFVVYSRAFVDRIPSYTPADGPLSDVAHSIANALANACSAINSNAADAVAPLISVAEGPATVPPPSTIDDVERVLPGQKICSEWEQLSVRFSEDTASWRALDPKIPASQWTTEQRNINDAAASVMSANADEMERLARNSGNPVVEDIALLAAQYRRGFAVAIPDYAAADNFLSETSVFLAKTIDWSCRAAQ
ncbi:hypothetical protein H7I41_11825 [Mycobacterium manitobense]|uniref:Uncharacterized protein n=1 Tax=[Mycobacterium] manitobense TaxID=190147 RepID=A0A9X2YMR7_9MYCO|nr:hypothetical protein [[Mycobacterium] manitobense]